MITALTISYETPEYLERLLSSFRKFYPDLPYMVIDGSSDANWEKIKDFGIKYGVKLIHFNYNIHHGPGMTHGIRLIKTDQILLVDSDMIIHSGGWLEMMEETLRKDSYGTGDVQKELWVTKVRDRRGRWVTDKEEIPYLHPAFALVNKNIVEDYPMPFKGGAPLLNAMKKIWDKGLSEKILQRSEWLTTDLWQHTCKYVQHNHNHAGMGTVNKTGGYHL